MDIDPSLVGPRIRAPFIPTADGCGAFVTGATTQPRQCGAQPVWAGLIYFEDPRAALFWSFTCDQHVGHLHAARRFLDRDRAEICRRRDQSALAMAGRRFARTEALATGQEARRRIVRAVELHTATQRGDNLDDPGTDRPTG